MYELKDKIALVTGAGQGIGKAIALTLAKHGASVVLFDIGDKIFDVLKEIEKLGVKGLAVKCDVSRAEEVEKAVKEAISEFGRINILVNNAGIYPFKPILQMTEQDWERVLDINLKGTFLVTRAVLPKMIEQRSGKIINIASIAGSMVGYSNLAHYSASKAGVVGFTRALALEVAPYGINVNAISPGPIQSPGTEAIGLTKEFYEQTVRSIPLGRMGLPEDVANLVVFLASDKSSFITGQNIVIDGGNTIL